MAPWYSFRIPIKWDDHDDRTAARTSSSPAAKPWMRSRQFCLSVLLSDAWQIAFLVMNINHVGRVFSYRSFWKKHIGFPHQIVSLPQGICQNWV